MNNDDFRRLLATPRAERFGGETPAAGKSGQAQAKPKPTGEYRPKPKPGFKKPTDKKKEDEDEDGPKYRDRAEERRRGKNSDYEDASAVLSALGGSGGGGGAGGGGPLGPDIGQVDLSKLSEEETKYLGGDMRFTHLVKGLDYALLHKTRSEITKKGDSDEEDEEHGEGQGARKEASREAAARAAAKANAAAGRKEEVRFVTPLARSVFSTLFAPPRASNVREMYGPRRTAFVYDFDNEDSPDTDVPTTLRRPKSECPQVAETLFAAVDNAVLERIAKIMSYVRTTADGKKLKKKDRDALLGIKSEADAAEKDLAGVSPGAPASAAATEPAKPAAPVDDDEDIFGDAGTDYQPTTKGAKAKDAAAPPGGARRPDGSYFDTKDTMDDIALPGTRLRRPGGAADQGADGGGGGGGDDMDLEEGEAAPAPAPGPQPQGYGGQQQVVQGYDAYGNPVYGGQYGAGGAYGQAPQQAANAYGTAEEPRWRASRTRDAKVKAVLGEADGEDDAYAEYYPGMAGYAGALADSDDEGDKGGTADMDSKTANKSKTRADFTTEEEYTRYKESREHNPKAAYQYGVKRADGRKSGKELEKSAMVEAKQRDQKLDGQLRKIKGIMDEKGLDHGTAFDRKPKEDRERGGGGGGGGGGGETPAHGRKRLRI